MCGFAGRAVLGGVADLELVAAMTAALAHRGPDGDGFFARGPIALCHRRLAIVDLAGGAQPMGNEDGTVQVVYNGEVYNHLDLRRELMARGHRFRTRCDTEAIVHAVEEEGAACVRRLRGMFAFAAWDATRRRLVLARDRVGIKPLYYAEVPDGIAFASELRALLLDPAVDRAVDEEALACYLALRYVPAPLTLLRGVRKLPPGCTLTWEDGRATVERYWDLADSPVGGAPPTEAEAAADLRERIDDVVELRLMSDVPLGAFLSGGLDSTLVTAAMLARRRGGERVKTFAVGYEDHAAASELAWAAHAAHSLGTDHREVHVSGGEVAAMLPAIAWSLDEPLADPAAVPLWFLARRAREEVKVVLSGEGGDEVFAGYAAYRWHAEMERLRALGLGALGAAVGRLAPSPRLRRAAALLGQPLPKRYRGIARAFDAAGLRRVVGVAGAAAAERALERTFAPLWETTRGLSPLRRMLYFDTRIWLPDDLLMKADKVTMAASIELRVPLLDHRLVEHAWALPDSYKLRGAIGKWLLRRAARGRVPEGILHRRKMGFSNPAPEWLRGPLYPLAREALLDGGALPALDRSRVATLLAEHRHGRNHTDELWALLTLELWRAGVRTVEAHASRPSAAQSNAGE